MLQKEVIRVCDYSDSVPKEPNLSSWINLFEIQNSVGEMLIFKYHLRHKKC